MTNFPPERQLVLIDKINFLNQTLDRFFANSLDRNAFRSIIPQETSETFYWSCAEIWILEEWNFEYYYPVSSVLLYLWHFIISLFIFVLDFIRKLSQISWVVLKLLQKTQYEWMEKKNQVISDSPYFNDVWVKIEMPWNIMFSKLMKKYSFSFIQ